ncbi:GPW/gp25 family protein [Crassaminicella profunda]|nr:GPW/gp25 family protein [Crassaminicella profunda]
MVTYEEDIQEAIKIILMTQKGERVMRPDFGCNMHDYVFSIPDYTTLNLMESEIRQALINWEPRIEEVDVNIHVDGEEANKLWINIDYVVRRTNNPFNLVYPFYLNEGIGR